MLLLLTLIGTTSMQTSSLEEKMAGNIRDKNLAFQAAESALKVAEASLSNLPTFTDAGTGGFYCKSSPIPTPSAILTNGFWTTNPVATYSASALGNSIADPRYIIVKLDLVDCLGGPVGTPQCRDYRITTRATGGTTNAVVILQSIYEVYESVPPTYPC
jgi:type IV pilus assembly protein PilX